MKTKADKPAPKATLPLQKIATWGDRHRATLNSKGTPKKK